MKNKKSSLSGSAVWVVWDRVGALSLQFVFSIVLARLLEPADFGLMAMITLFLGLATRLSFGGFGSALIQRKQLSDGDISTAFWFNAASGLMAMAALYFLAPFVSSFYGEARLVGIIRMCSITVLLSSLSVTYSALFLREMNYRPRAVSNIMGCVVSGGVGVWMAARGFGVWALVAQGVFMHLVTMVLYVSFSKWHPLFHFQLQSFKEMFSFGKNILISVLCRTLTDQLQTVVVGKFYSTVDLGYLHRAGRFSILLSQTPALALSQVSFPLLSREIRENKNMEPRFCQVVRWSLFFIIPLSFGMSAASGNFIVFLIGEKWLPSVPYLRVLCLSGLLLFMHMLNSDLLKAAGDSKTFLKCDMVMQFLVGLSVILCLNISIQAMLYGHLVAMLISACFTMHKAMAVLDSTWLKQVKWFGPYLIGVIPMVLVIGIIDLTHVGWYILPLQALAGSVMYLSVVWIMREPVMRELLFKINPLRFPHCSSDEG